MCFREFIAIPDLLPEPILKIATASSNDYQSTCSHGQRRGLTLKNIALIFAHGSGLLIAIGNQACEIFALDHFDPLTGADRLYVKLIDEFRHEWILGVSPSPSLS